MTAPAYSPDTLHLIHRLERATAARARCQKQATHATTRATLAATDAGRAEWESIAIEARACRDAWDDEIRSLRRQLLAPA